MDPVHTYPKEFSNVEVIEAVSDYGGGAHWCNAWLPQDTCMASTSSTAIQVLLRFCNALVNYLVFYGICY